MSLCRCLNIATELFDNWRLSFQTEVFFTVPFDTFFCLLIGKIDISKTFASRLWYLNRSRKPCRGDTMISVCPKHNDIDVFYFLNTSLHGFPEYICTRFITLVNSTRLLVY